MSVRSAPSSDPLAGSFVALLDQIEVEVVALKSLDQHHIDALLAALSPAALRVATPGLSVVHTEGAQDPPPLGARAARRASPTTRRSTRTIAVAGVTTALLVAGVGVAAAAPGSLLYPVKATITGEPLEDDSTVTAATGDPTSMGTLTQSVTAAFLRGAVMPSASPDGSPSAQHTQGPTLAPDTHAGTPGSGGSGGSGGTQIAHTTAPTTGTHSSDHQAGGSGATNGQAGDNHNGTHTSTSPEPHASATPTPTPTPTPSASPSSGHHHHGTPGTTPRTPGDPTPTPSTSTNAPAPTTPPVPKTPKTPGHESHHD
jgi:hypothetical protein